MERTLTSLILSTLLSTNCAYADDQPAGDDAGRWRGALGIGLVRWTDLKEVEPSVGGNFSSLGFALELAAHKRVSRWGSTEVLVGADIGILAIKSSDRRQSVLS